MNTEETLKAKDAAGLLSGKIVDIIFFGKYHTKIIFKDGTELYFQSEPTWPDSSSLVIELNNKDVIIS